MAKYKCKVCGYIHEGNKAPDVCPVCAAPASDFEEMKDEAAADKKKGLDRDSNVYTVVYASVMVVLVAVVLAFTSQSLRTFQQKNEENDKRQQILRSINVTVPANEAEAKYSELIKEAFLVNENGEKDYECFEAVDHQLLTEQVALLLKGETVKTPVYSFIEGSKEFIRELKLEKNDILLIEGIHALNPKVLDTISAKNKYKIYLSALTELNIDSHNRFSTTDNRLLRRIIRDSRTRGYDVVDTIAIWPKVRAGEEKYIFPYQDEADSTINTALIYELGVLKTYVEPLLYSVDEDSIYYDEAKRLLNLFRLILPIPSEAIPADSILREFVGGSCFHE